MHEVFASLFNDRAIAYRVHQGFDHAEVALSAGVQHMVRSDLGASGVMFTLDTESGLPRRRVHHGVVRPRRDGRAGRGESGRVLRLQAGAARRARRRSCAARSARKAIKMVYARARHASERVTTVEVARGRPHALLASTIADMLELARQALIIEEHYGRPMDIEWGKDGETARSTSCRRGRRPCRAAPAAPCSATR